MKLITFDTDCIYYGNAGHSFTEAGLVCDGETYAVLTEENTQVHTDVTAPDDFTLFKYNYVDNAFVISNAYTRLSEIKRAERNALLAETDWWAVADRTMTQAETDYRQALRDVPQQDGFPVDITWPTKPE